MFSDSQRTMLREYGTLVGRILMGLLFIVSGLNIIFGEVGIVGTAEHYTTMSIPMASIVVWLVIALKLVAGGALMAGYRVGLAAAALALFTLATIFIAHFDLSDTNFFKNLAIIGGLLYVMAYGPGEGWSMKGRRTMPAQSNSPTGEEPML